MGGWISVGLGAAAALCPLPHHGDVTVVMDHAPGRDHLVVCAPDVRVDMGYGDVAPEVPPPTCTPPAAHAPHTSPPPAPAPPPPPPSALPQPAPSVPRGPAPSPTPQAAPASAAPAPAAPPPPGPEPAPAAPVPSAIPVPASSPPAKAPEAFRWVPRSHYTGGPSRPAPARLSMTMSTVVVTLPAVLAAAALRPGSRRRGRG
ncbi:hypothetical protein ABZ946_00745 [Streptomyces sp. NPDC046324]|uniref:hypothetical protein n=1 Tax=Streptomyces sp. NPDC046324 TaxID=3154915 RepID=UPI0033DBFC6C